MLAEGPLAHLAGEELGGEEMGADHVVRGELPEHLSQLLGVEPLDCDPQPGEGRIDLFPVGLVVQVPPEGGVVLHHFNVGVGVDGLEQLRHQLHQIDVDHLDAGIPLFGRGLKCLGCPDVAGAGGDAEDGDLLHFVGRVGHGVTFEGT